MNILGRCILVATVAFFFAVIGIFTHQLFPHSIIVSGDLARSVSGLIGTLFAIVLGLLVSSSYAAFNSHQADFNSLVSTIANIDLLLKQFPEESSRPRTLLRGVALRLRERYWPDKKERQHYNVNYKHLSNDIETILEINSIAQNFEKIHRDDLNSIRQFSNSFVSIQSNIIRSLSNQIPALLLVVVFGWACLLFFLYGCLSNGNPFTIFFLLLGAIAIASANFLILELTHPYQGIFKVSSAAFDMLVDSLSQERD